MIENTDHKRDRDTLADVGLRYPGWICILGCLINAN